MKIEIDHDTLRPLVEEIVKQVLAIVGNGDNRISYLEREAAEKLGMAAHQLRDRRLEGAIKGKKVGKSYYYTRDELLRFVKAK